MSAFWWTITCTLGRIYTASVLSGFGCPPRKWKKVTDNTIFLHLIAQKLQTVRSWSVACKCSMATAGWPCISSFEYISNMSIINELTVATYIDVIGGIRKDIIENWYRASDTGCFTTCWPPHSVIRHLGLTSSANGTVFCFCCLCRCYLMFLARRTKLAL